MLRKHQSLLSKSYAVLDSLMIVLALLAAWWLRFDTRLLPQYHALPFQVYVSILIEAVPAFWVASSLFGLYGTTRNSSLRTVSLQIAKTVAVMALVVMSVLYFDHQVHYSRAVVLMFDILSWAFAVIGRMIVREALKEARRRGLNRKYVLLVGSSNAAVRFVEKLRQHDELGYHVLGYLHLQGEADARTSMIAVGGEAGSTGARAAMSPAHAARGSAVRVGGLAPGAVARSQADAVAPGAAGLDAQGIRQLGTAADLDRVLRQHIVDHVILTMPGDRSEMLAEMIAVAESHGVHSLLVPDFVDILPSRPRFDEFAGLPIVDTRYTPLDESLNAGLKRLFDVVFSLLVLTLGAPVFAVIAASVRLSSPGPIIYAQERLGRNRRSFKMYKFRTMYHSELPPDALVGAREETAAGALPYSQPYAQPGDDDGWTIPHDPRRTAVGRLLRRTSLDELPQFYNVLLGHMSVIGPRPERPVYVEKFRSDVPRYMIKHRIRPGITGWAQVNGLRGDTSIEDRIEYDLSYIEHWSFSWDLRIIMLTLVKGFRNKNAY